MDVNVTLQLLASPQSDISEINGAEESADHVIRLIAAVFRLCEFEKKAIAANLTSLLSPELSCTIIWFLHRWSLRYLLIVENHYSEISTTILEAYGEESPAALWTMNYLLEKITCNINAFKSEPTLIKYTIQLLVALVKYRNKYVSTFPRKVFFFPFFLLGSFSFHRAACFLKSECLGSLIELATKSRYDLPQTAKRGLVRVVVQVGAALRDDSHKDQYWAQTLQPLLDRFKQIISNEYFTRSYHEEQIKIQLMELFESYIGQYKYLPQITESHEILNRNT